MKQRQTRFIQEAVQDLRGGQEFYERNQQGIGLYFRDSVLADIESLWIHAGVHEQHHGYYRLLAKHFPYAVYYALDPKHISIMAILPVRRSPAWILTQLGKR